MRPIARLASPRTTPPPGAGIGRGAGRQPGTARLRQPLALCLVAAAMLSTLGAGLAAGQEPSDEPETRARIEQHSPTEVNRNVTDPVSLTWSLKLENDVNFLDIDGHGNPVQDVIKLQPTMPMLLTPALKIIARPQFTLLDSKPYTSDGDLERATGVGDTVLDLVLSPVSAHWLLALGSTFILPTASTEQTGQGKWQAGPGSVLGYRTPEWLAALIEQQWWSFGGSADRPSVSEMHLQYLASYFLADGWSVGTAPTIQVDWRATAGNRVTFPLGPNVAKVVKLGEGLPVKFELDALYVPVRPDNGERFSIEIKITPVIPAPITGPWLAP